MAGIKQPILDILTKLKDVTEIQYIRIWNNQVKHEDEGKIYDWPKPAVFLEVISSPQWQEMGNGYQGADIGWRLHLVHEQFDAQDGTFEQNLAVFDIRDNIVRKLSFYEPTGCGPLVKRSEGFDYDHTQIYVYVIDFTCFFIDSKGAKTDPDAGLFIDKAPPTTVQLNVGVVDTIPNENISPKDFRIQK
jgi:hypothetical protein